MFLKKAIIHTIENHSPTLSDLIEHLNAPDTELYQQNQIIQDIYSLIKEGIIHYEDERLKIK